MSKFKFLPVCGEGACLFKLLMSKFKFLPVCGEGACLVRADGGGVAHRLAGVQVAHKVVVAHHFL